MRPCRKCQGPLVPLDFPNIGVSWLPKGGCCGACHFRWARSHAGQVQS